MAAAAVAEETENTAESSSVTVQVCFLYLPCSLFPVCNVWLGQSWPTCNVQCGQSCPNFVIPAPFAMYSMVSHAGLVMSHADTNCFV